MNWSNHKKKKKQKGKEKKETLLFYSGKNFSTEAKTIASSYSVDLPSLSIRQGGLPILVHFYPPARECE